MARVDDNRRKLIEYLSNPEHEFITRTRMSIEVLGYANKETMYRFFSPTDLDEIEAEAFELRKKRCIRQQETLFKSLYKHGVDGNVPAAKEWLERMAGKVTDKVESTSKVEVTGFNINLIKPKDKK